MLNIIFGAGASHDCVVKKAVTVNGQHIPPLSGGLFENRPLMVKALERYPECSNIAYQVSSEVSSGASLEKVMERYAANPQKRKELIAIKFYLRDIFSEISESYLYGNERRNNYSALFDFLDDFNAEHSFITFNYDTLIEEVISSRTEKEFNSVTDYYRHDFLLAKMHGSANWGYEMNGDLYEVYEDEYECAVKQGLEFKNGPIQIDNSNRPCYPALSIPTSQKDNSYFECPDEMKNKVSENLKNTTKLIIIGWKGREEHFNREYLSKIPPGKETKILIVANGIGSAGAIKEYFLKNNLLQNNSISLSQARGFSEFISRPDELMTFLKQ